MQGNMKSWLWCIPKINLTSELSVPSGAAGIQGCIAYARNDNPDEFRDEPFRVDSVINYILL